ncbi:MAG: hypothetical protein ACJAUH_000356 [Saprospiraceae bacterium]|jgi:hypothetical protein
MQTPHIFTTNEILQDIVRLNTASIDLQTIPMFVLSCEMNAIHLLIYDLENDTILSWKN